MLMPDLPWTLPLTLHPRRVRVWSTAAAAFVDADAPLRFDEWIWYAAALADQDARFRLRMDEAIAAGQRAADSAADSAA